MLFVFCALLPAALSLKAVKFQEHHHHAGRDHHAEDPGYGLRFADLDMSEQPVKVTHIFNVDGSQVTFILSQALGLKSGAQKCTEGCGECNRPFVNIDQRDNASTYDGKMGARFQCITDRGSPRVAVVEGYKPVEVQHCDGYHRASTFAVTCDVDETTRSIRLQLATSESQRYNYRAVEIPRTAAPNHNKRPAKFNLAGCLMFNAAYSSWSMLFAQLAFQRLQGFDHTYVYDGTPESLRSETYQIQLQRLKQWRQHVTHMPWISVASLSEDVQGQGFGHFDDLAINEYTTYAHCHYFLRDRAHWIANNHVDEFVSVKPGGPYESVSKVLMSLPSDVGSMMFYARDVQAYQSLDDAHGKMLSEYVNAGNENRIGNEGLIFDLAKDGHLWHSDLPRGSPFGWEGIYRPENLTSLHCQWGVAKSGVRTVLSNPEIGIVTEHVRASAVAKVNENTIVAFSTMNHALLDPFSKRKGTSTHLYYEIPEALAETWPMRSRSSKPFYYENTRGGGQLQVESKFKQMRWFGEWGPRIRDIIEANGRL